MITDNSVDEVLNALDRAKANVPKDWDYLATDEDVMFQVMELEYCLKPLGDHLGVSEKLFPPMEELENDEIKMIVEKILDTWATYNYIADLPNGLPIRIAYKVLLSVWNEVIPCCPTGNFHFDFYDQELEQYIKRDF